jgi:hypothetical protein
MFKKRIRTARRVITGGFFFHATMVSEIQNRMSKMFKFIGATIVYGFATYGLVTWLLRSEKDDEE